MRIVNLTLIALGVLSIFVAAARSAQPDATFQAKDLPSLDLGNVGDFWKDEPATQKASPGGNFPGEAYLGSLEYTRGSKGIRVTVYRSQEDAVKAMEERRLLVAAAILPGDATDWTQRDVRNTHPVTVPWDANTFGGLKWFWMAPSPGSVYVNCRNSIVEVERYQPPFDKNKELLRKTAAIVARRIAQKCGLTVELRFRKKTPAFAASESIVAEAWFVNRTDKPLVYRGGLGDAQAKHGCQVRLMAEGRKKAWSAMADAAPAFRNYNDIKVPAGGQTLVGQWDLGKLAYCEGRLAAAGKIPFADIGRPGQYRVCWWDGVFQLGTPLWSEPVDFEIVQTARPSTAKPPATPGGKGGRG